MPSISIDTAHKVPVIVRTASGQFVPAGNQQWSLSPENIAGAEGTSTVPGVGECYYLAGVAAGTTTLTITGGGSSVTVDVTVTKAPLLVEFGQPVAR